ncbi:MAG: hypothetical protein VYD87_02425 [Pseudomonadota bacterium]|nr:hypothetical protein [Pseudomonadota bacterium]
MFRQAGLCSALLATAAFFATPSFAFTITDFTIEPEIPVVGEPNTADWDSSDDAFFYVFYDYELDPGDSAVRIFVDFYADDVLLTNIGLGAGVTFPGTSGDDISGAGQNRFSGLPRTANRIRFYGEEVAYDPIEDDYEYTGGVEEQYFFIEEIHFGPAASVSAAVPLPPALAFYGVGLFAAGLFGFGRGRAVAG